MKRPSDPKTLVMPMRTETKMQSKDTQHPSEERMWGSDSVFKKINKLYFLDNLIWKTFFSNDEN